MKKSLEKRPWEDLDVNKLKSVPKEYRKSTIVFSKNKGYPRLYILIKKNTSYPVQWDGGGMVFPPKGVSIEALYQRVVGSNLISCPIPHDLWDRVSEKVKEVLSQKKETQK